MPVCAAAKTLLSPSEFLGYDLGERFTPHHRVVAYFEHAAKAAPSKMKWQSYGKTYEGRDLNYAVVSSADNINKIGSIQTNNLRLAGVAEGTGDVD